VIENEQVGLFLRHLRHLVGVRLQDATSDCQLLKRFADEHHEASFAALVERHGRLVLGVCRRVLGNEQDAEDAFQATFLVLARKAGSVRWQDSIGNWLYGVARRIALKARAARDRRRRHERVMSTDPAQDTAQDALACSEAADKDPLTEATRRDACRVLDEELGCLPRRYQALLILCYFEGKTHEEAARQLGWPTGSMSRHIARGRELLRERLLRRDVTLSTAALGIVLAGEVQASLVPRALLDSIIKPALLFVERPTAVAGMLSSPVISLAEGMLQTMMFSKLKIGLAMLLTIGLLGAGVAGGFLPGDEAGRTPTTQKKAAVESKGAPPKVGPTTMKKIAAPAKFRGNLPDRWPDEADGLAIMRLQETLNKLVSLDKGIDRKTPLRDAMEFLSDRYNVTILIDNAAFKLESIDNVEDLPVHLPRISNVRLQTVLQLLSNQVNGSYLVKPDGIEITTRGRARPEDWISNRNLPPLVTLNCEHQLLEPTLKKLEFMTGISVVLDARVALKLRQEGQIDINVMLNNVPLDTAVRLLADMSDLGVVAIDSVLYVTTKNNADQLQQDQEARRQKMHQTEKQPGTAPKQSKKAKK